MSHSVIASCNLQLHEKKIMEKAAAIMTGADNSGMIICRRFCLFVFDGKTISSYEAFILIHRIGLWGRAPSEGEDRGVYENFYCSPIRFMKDLWKLLIFSLLNLDFSPYTGYSKNHIMCAKGITFQIVLKGIWSIATPCKFATQYSDDEVNMMWSKALKHICMMSIYICMMKDVEVRKSLRMHPAIDFLWANLATDRIQ